MSKLYDINDPAIVARWREVLHEESTRESIWAPTLRPLPWHRARLNLARIWVADGLRAIANGIWPQL